MHRLVVCRLVKDNNPFLETVEHVAVLLEFESLDAVGDALGDDLAVEGENAVDKQGRKLQT